MQSHRDEQHAARFIERLKKRAEQAQKAKASIITTGDEPLASWQGSNGVHINHLPDDEQGVLRISIGGGDHLPVTLNYCTIRGDLGQCIKLLEMARLALKEAP